VRRGSQLAIMCILEQANAVVVPSVQAGKHVAGVPAKELPTA